jgi:hypothetical protein
MEEWLSVMVKDVISFTAYCIGNQGLADLSRMVGSKITSGWHLFQYYCGSVEKL